MESFGWEAQKRINLVELCPCRKNCIVQMFSHCNLFTSGAFAYFWGLFLLYFAGLTNVAKHRDTSFCHHGRVVGPWLFMVGRVYLVYLQKLHLNFVDLTLGITHV